MPQSKDLRLDEFAICIRPGFAIGWLTDGIAGLAIDWDAEQGRAYVKRVEYITLAVNDLMRERPPPLRVKLDPDSDVFKMIEAEIHRRDDDGDLYLEYQRGPDPDYLRDLREGDRLDAMLNGARP